MVGILGKPEISEAEQRERTCLHGCYDPGWYRTSHKTPFIFHSLLLVHLSKQVNENAVTSEIVSFVEMFMPQEDQYLGRVILLVGF